jgi:hypothetical protein
MPESPTDLHRRAAGAPRTPPVAEWETWPFDGPVRPRALAAPVPEPPRQGEGGMPCAACAKPDDAYLWTDDHWRLAGIGPSGLPVVVLLEPRASFAELWDEVLPPTPEAVWRDDLARVAAAMGS